MALRNSHLPTTMESAGESYNEQKWTFVLDLQLELRKTRLQKEEVAFSRLR